MANVVFSEQAYDDLDEIFTYLAARDFSAAERYLGEVRASCFRLGDFPELGRRYDKAYRVLVVRNHLIFYRYESRRARVNIVTVIDGRRDLADLLPKLLK